MGMGRKLDSLRKRVKLLEREMDALHTKLSKLTDPKGAARKKPGKAKARKSAPRPAVAPKSKKAKSAITRGAKPVGRNRKSNAVAPAPADAPQGAPAAAVGQSAQ